MNARNRFPPEFALQAAAMAALLASLGGCRGLPAALGGRLPLGASPPPIAAPNPPPPLPPTQFAPPRIVLDRSLDPQLEGSIRAELTVLAGRLQERLGVFPVACPLTVTVLGDEATYASYVRTRFPQFPERRAIFADHGDRQEVVTAWGPSLREDLRHETTHGYLHAAIGQIPLWLDEGLAEYFETGPLPGEVQPGHVALLAAQRDLAGWVPDLGRLERLHDAATMTELDYAESWLWVHFMLHASASHADQLRHCLAELREARGTESVLPLSRRMPPSATADLGHWLAALPPTAEAAGPQE